MTKFVNSDAAECAFKAEKITDKTGERSRIRQFIRKININNVNLSIFEECLYKDMTKINKSIKWYGVIPSEDVDNNQHKIETVIK